jgi:uncharacterized protein (TIGR02246 family)
MPAYMKTIILLGTLSLTCLQADLLAADAANEQASDRQAIFNNAKTFVSAFEQGDADGVASMWSEDGDYTDLTGRHLEGRTAIKNAFADFFNENKGSKLRIDVISLRFITPDTAIEDGITSLTSADGSPPNQARYTNVHVKKNGQWFLESVREAPYVSSGNYEHLRGLEWAVGEWVDEGNGPEVDHVRFEWSEDGNFLISTQDVTVKDTRISRATEWIGWDPTGQQVRSWSFVTDGSVGQSTWSNDGNQWMIKTSAILSNGKKLTATNIVTREDPDTITWQSKDRTLDGTALPDVDKVRMKRVPSGAKTANQD